MSWKKRNIGLCDPSLVNPMKPSRHGRAISPIRSDRVFSTILSTSWTPQTLPKRLGPWLGIIPISCKNHGKKNMAYGVGLPHWCQRIFTQAQNHMLCCHREIAIVSFRVWNQSAWSHTPKELVPQISGRLGHFSNNEICNFDSKVTIKIAQTKTGSKWEAYLPQEIHLSHHFPHFKSSNQDQSWLVV